MRRGAGDVRSRTTFTAAEGLHARPSLSSLRDWSAQGLYFSTDLRGTYLVAESVSLDSPCEATAIVLRLRRWNRARSRRTGRLANGRERPNSESQVLSIDCFSRMAPGRVGETAAS